MFFMRERERDQRSEIVKLKCNEQKPDTRDGRKTMKKRALRTTTTTTTTTRNNRRRRWCERIPFETWWESLEISFLCALMKVKKMRGNERKSVFAAFFRLFFSLHSLEQKRFWWMKRTLVVVVAPLTAPLQRRGKGRAFSGWHGGIKHGLDG